MFQYTQHCFLKWKQFWLKLFSLCYLRGLRCKAFSVIKINDPQCKKEWPTAYLNLFLINIIVITIIDNSLCHAGIYEIDDGIGA